MALRTTLAIAAAVLSLIPVQHAAQAQATSRATRFKENPLITVRSSTSLGDNVDGPSIIRVPAWVKAPLGRYYMYFAHHEGESIRLAYADDIRGPWKIHEPGVLHQRDTAFYRQQPDPPGRPKTHVASPEIYIDSSSRRIVMWFHGWWTGNEPWPPGGPPTLAPWLRERGYGQFTQASESRDGLRFEVRGGITRDSYLRVFRWQNMFYGVARLGRLGRSRDLLAEFELGPNPFRDTAYNGRVRHVALLRRGATLHVFFSAIGDAPERILMSTIDLRGSWDTWKATAPVDVLQPEAPYECAHMAIAPSTMGGENTPVRELRDPAVFEEHGRVWLFYSICGEQGIAGAEVTLPKGR